MIAGALVPITRQMSRGQRRTGCVDAICYAPSAPPEILDSSVNRALHALPTGSNLRRFESSIAHRRNLLSTGSTTNTSRTVPSVITVSSKTTMPTGGVAVDGGEYLYFESATINFGGVLHLSVDSSPSAIAPLEQLRSKAPNSFSLTRITPWVSREQSASHFASRARNARGLDPFVSEQRDKIAQTV